MNDYLWDKSGEPDPEIQRLEELLGGLAHRPGAVPRLPTPRRSPWIPLAIAASVLILLLGGGWLFVRPSGPAWQVSALAGKPARTRLARGQSLSTDANSRAKLELASVGEVEVEPNSQVRVMAINPNEERLDLKRGTIHALIWAPPGRFFVNTPSAVTVDLGCAYTLEVDAAGVGLVKVTAGWVAFENKGRESFIPATAECVTRPGKGPGIPYYQDATEGLKAAVNRFDSDGGSTAVILAQARPRDAITLWHLLRRVPAAERGAVYDRLAALMTIPPAATRAGVMDGDPRQIDALWDALDLGTTTWWREWKRNY